MHYSVGLIAIIAIMTVMLYRHPAHAKSVLVKSEYRTITPKDAKESMDAGLTCIRLDVRQPYEYAAGHIPGAVNAPLGRLEHYARNNLKTGTPPSTSIAFPALEAVLQT